MRKMKYISFLALFFMMIVLTSVYAADSVAVSCYVGDPSDNIDLGDIEVFNIADAADACNDTFDDCQENCTGCYINAGSIEICVDEDGEEFTIE